MWGLHDIVQAKLYKHQHNSEAHLFPPKQVYLHSTFHIQNIKMYCQHISAVQNTSNVLRLYYFLAFIPLF